MQVFHQSLEPFPAISPTLKMEIKQSELENPSHNANFSDAASSLTKSTKNKRAPWAPAIDLTEAPEAVESRTQ